jgi:hypothetical protein
MSIAERELWMLSHRAPEGMIMVHESEMKAISLQVASLGIEHQMVLAALGKLRKNDESPVATIKRLLENLKKAMEQ